jgi:hypothetical protein
VVNPFGGGGPLRIDHELMAFRPRVTGSQQVGKVAVRGWDVGRREGIERTVTAETAGVQLSERGWSAADIAGKFGNPTYVVCDRPIRTVAEADKVAESAAEEVASSFAEADGTAIGDPRLVTGTIVEVEGAGPFDGTWLLSHTHHRFDEDGYYTDFEVSGRQERSLLGLASLGATGAGSKPVYGAVIGLVTSIKDPEKAGRVKLKFPWLDDSYESDWARTCFPGAGDGRGLMIVPEVDDEVLVMFEFGDVRAPYVIGSLYNGQAKAPNEGYVDDGATSAGTNLLREWKTRRGHTLSFDDDNDHVHLYLEGGKHSIRISSKDDEIVVTSSGSLVLEGKEKVEISGTGDHDQRHQRHDRGVQPARVEGGEHHARGIRADRRQRWRRQDQLTASAIAPASAIRTGISHHSRGENDMGTPAAVLGDRISASCAGHQVPNPASGVPQPGPPMPLRSRRRSASSSAPRPASGRCGLSSAAASTTTSSPRSTTPRIGTIAFEVERVARPLGAAHRDVERASTSTFDDEHRGCSTSRWATGEADQRRAQPRLPLLLRSPVRGVRHALPAPDLDDRRFQDLVDDAKRLVQQRCPEWTDHNVSDPGVTLIELFAWMTDQLLYRLNRVPDRHYVKFLELSGVRATRPPPRAGVTFWLSAAASRGRDGARRHPGLHPFSESRTSVDFVTTDELDIPLLADRLSGPGRGKVTYDHDAPQGCRSRSTASARCPSRRRPARRARRRRASLRGRAHARLPHRGRRRGPGRPPAALGGLDRGDWAPCEVDRDETGGLNRSGDGRPARPADHVVSVIDGAGRLAPGRVLEPEEGQPAYSRPPEDLGR